MDIATSLQRQCCSYFFLLFPGTSLALVLFTRYSAFSSRSLVSHHRSYAATTSPFSDITCACAHYLLLRFLPVVPSLFLSGKRPRMNQGRTKEQPKNSKSQKRLFIKICFPLYLASFHRETTERRPSKERHNSLPTKSAVS